jgi:arsenite methyltransferase
MQPTYSITSQEAPDYDFHIPRQFTYPLPVATLSILIGCLLYFLLRESQIFVAGVLGAISFLAGGVYVGVFAVLKRITNLDRRLLARDKFLDVIPWQGNETVLDVGCGNGILTMGAAKRLRAGKIIGIDIWTEGSGDNKPETFRKNAQIEGVADRVSLENESVLQLPYADESYDVIISGLTIHHLGFNTPKSIAEMTRVLKPGGWMAIYDEPSTVFYSAKLMRQNGLQITKKTMDMIFGVKPHVMLDK